MSEHSNPDTNPQTDEQELCAQCLTGNRPGTNFCRKCGAPLSSYAATGPFEHLFAEGHVYRKAAEQPQRPIVVAGMWVIFGNMALMGGLLVAMGWNTKSPAGILGGAALLAVSVFLIAKTTLNYRNRRTGGGGELVDGAGE